MPYTSLFRARWASPESALWRRSSAFRTAISARSASPFLASALWLRRTTSTGGRLRAEAAFLAASGLTSYLCGHGSWAQPARRGDHLHRRAGLVDHRGRAAMAGRGRGAWIRQPGPRDAGAVRRRQRRPDGRRRHRRQYRGLSAADDADRRRAAAKRRGGGAVAAAGEIGRLPSAPVARHRLAPCYTMKISRSARFSASGTSW